MGAGGAGGWESRSIHPGETILPKKFMQVLKMAINYGPAEPVTKLQPSVTKPRYETPTVTKPYTVVGRTVDGVEILKPVTEPTHFTSEEIRSTIADIRKRGGRPPAGAVAMSDAERMRKYRARRRGAVAAS
jgi:hypothetical protein